MGITHSRRWVNPETKVSLPSEASIHNRETAICLPDSNSPQDAGGVFQQKLHLLTTKPVANLFLDAETADRLGWTVIPEQQADITLTPE